MRDQAIAQPGSELLANKRLTQNSEFARLFFHLGFYTLLVFTAFFTLVRYSRKVQPLHPTFCTSLAWKRLYTLVELCKPIWFESGCFVSRGVMKNSAKY
jgi:hypothetical protein